MQSLYGSANPVGVGGILIEIRWERGAEQCDARRLSFDSHKGTGYNSDEV